MLAGQRQRLEALANADSFASEIAWAKRPKRRSWTIASAVDGIERAGLVVINVRNEEERAVGAQMIADLKRIRSDAAIFTDIVWIGPPRYPITGVVADLTEPRDPDLKKAIARIRRRSAPPFPEAPRRRLPDVRELPRPTSSAPSWLEV